MKIIGVLASFNASVVDVPNRDSVGNSSCSALKPVFLGVILGWIKFICGLKGRPSG